MSLPAGIAGTENSIQPTNTAVQPTLVAKIDKIAKTAPDYMCASGTQDPVFKDTKFVISYSGGPNNTPWTTMDVSKMFLISVESDCQLAGVTD